MADTFERATNNKDAAGMIRNFSDEFGKRFEYYHVMLVKHSN